MTCRTTLLACLRLLLSAVGAGAQVDRIMPVTDPMLYASWSMRPAAGRSPPLGPRAGDFVAAVESPGGRPRLTPKVRRPEIGNGPYVFALPEDD